MEPFPAITHHIVSRETFDVVDHLVEKNRSSLEEYLDRLLWWNGRVNLISRNVPRETVWEHLRHSLLLSRFDVLQQADYIIDAGTGGGMPGIPLAIVFPGKNFLLNDIVSKKIRAVRQMVYQLKLDNVVTADRSIEETEIPPSSLLISKHAFKIDELWKMVKKRPWSAMVFYKGINFEEELEEIEEPLTVESFKLGQSRFYEGKSIVIVTRRRPVISDGRRETAPGS